MTNAIKEETISRERLETMTGKELAGYFGVSRNTAVAAREIVLKDRRVKN